MSIHTPVFLEQAINVLQVTEGGLYIDATTGEGGHTRQILARGGRVLALDWDSAQYQKLVNQFAGTAQVQVVLSNFSTIEKVAQENQFGLVDGVLFDFGLSMEQIARSGRGFSFKANAEPLDMRIHEGEGTTAADIVNSYSLEDLYTMFAKNSEDVHAHDVAENIVRSRRLNHIHTVGDLKQAMGQVGSFARIFQALRIEVNHEFENIREGLAGAWNLLKPEGRIVVITFHSLEDRMVKQFAKEKGCAVQKVKPADFGVKKSFERSAMLRIIVKN
ncbi:16S rRNA (cytosine(1402)-N(4))-methyltransferase RsmH [Candidatus Roizmanbacteria bacterium]|nr:16S rRNA (cytosine(1402)-N(4))-methyltransferase RsmH [Candidatus Roizmanbacteria bacterium]